MDDIDRKICGILQTNGKTSSAELAEAVGVSLSTANERVRRLANRGVIRGWRAVLDPGRVGAGLCAFVFLDVAYAGEQAAIAALAERPEVQELHHVSGPRSYLMKIRVQDTEALEFFLQEVVKPLPAVQRTETVLAISTRKETSAVHLSGEAAER